MRTGGLFRLGTAALAKLTASPVLGSVILIAFETRGAGDVVAATLPEDGAREGPFAIAAVDEIKGAL